MQPGSQRFILGQRQQTRFGSDSTSAQLIPRALCSKQNLDRIELLMRNRLGKCFLKNLNHASKLVATGIFRSETATTNIVPIKNTSNAFGTVPFRFELWKRVTHARTAYEYLEITGKAVWLINYESKQATDFLTRNSGHYWTLWWKWNWRCWNSSCEAWASITPILHDDVIMTSLVLTHKMSKRSYQVNIKTANSSILSKVRFSTQ